MSIFLVKYKWHTVNNCVILWAGDCDDNLWSFQKFAKIRIHPAKCLNLSILYRAFGKLKNMVKTKSKSWPAVMNSKDDYSGSSNISTRKVQCIRGNLTTIMKSAVKKKKAKKSMFHIDTSSESSFSDTSLEDYKAEWVNLQNII